LRAGVESETTCVDPSDDHAGSERRNFAVRKKAKSKVNAAGNYTKPELRKRLFNSIKAANTQGTGAGRWSARKAQLLAKKYKEKGGSYRG
jgi:hypothetical protein